MNYKNETKFKKTKCLADLEYCLRIKKVFNFCISFLNEYFLFLTFYIDGFLINERDPIV